MNQTTSPTLVVYGLFSISSFAKHMWYFYVLQSLKNKNWLYKGSTNNLNRRLIQHNSGQVKSTKPYQPFELVYYEAYKYEFAARIRESHVKKSGSIWVPMRKRILNSLNKY